MKKKEVKQFPKFKYQENKIKIKESWKVANKLFSYNNNSNINKNISTQISTIISKNLMKYSISKKKYNIYIINSIIFDQKNHIVTEFKNYLLWDETSEFLKRFYNSIESFDRLPSICQYYETYTLFSPIYFGLGGPLIIIMNEWTRKKKNYLEYIEDKEEEDEKKNKEEVGGNFKKLIKTNLLCSASSNSISKKTIELTKYDNVDSFFIKDNKDLSLLEKEENNKKITENNISLSKIMDDLSSNYSIYIVNSNNIKKKEENKSKNGCSKKTKDYKKEISKKEKNIVLSDKVLLSFTNLNKNRNKKYSNNKMLKKYCFGTSNNSTSKAKRNTLNEKNKEKNKIKSKINFQANETKNSIKKRIKNNNLQITLNTFTRNKNSSKEKKDIIKKHALTNTNTNINITSYYSSANISLSKIKAKKQKMKRIYLRNLKLITQSYNCNAIKLNSPSSNTLDINQNDNTNYNNKNQNIKCNFIRLLTYKDGKYKRFLLNGNKNKKNNCFQGYYKPNITQANYDPFKSKRNKLIREKRVVTTTNSFSNKNKNNSKKENQSIKINTNNLNNFLILNKKLSNRNLARNLVLSQFHSKKEIVHKSKISSNNNSIHCKMISSMSKQITSRNSSLTKSKIRNLNGKINKKLNESLSIKPYKKELNKINLNFNFNINFNFDINKNRKKKFLLSQKNNIGFLTQRNPILKGNKTNKSKSRGENSQKKNVLNSIIKNMKNDYNLRLKKLSKNI